MKIKVAMSNQKVEEFREVCDINRSLNHDTVTAVEHSKDAVFERKLYVGRLLKQSRRNSVVFNRGKWNKCPDSLRNSLQRNQDI